MNDGDVYFDPFFEELWVVEGDYFLKINDVDTATIERTPGFVKVGHIDLCPCVPKTCGDCVHCNHPFDYNGKEDKSSYVCAEKDLFIKPTSRACDGIEEKE